MNKEKIINKAIREAIKKHYCPVCNGRMFVVKGEKLNTILCKKHLRK